MSISHLLFSDNSLSFFEVNVDQGMAIKKLLSTFDHFLSPRKCLLPLNENENVANAEQVWQILGPQN